MLAISRDARHICAYCMMAACPIFGLRYFVVFVFFSLPLHSRSSFIAVSFLHLVSLFASLWWKQVLLKRNWKCPSVHYYILFFFTNDPSTDIPSLPALLPSSPFPPCIPLRSSICSTNTPSIHFFDTTLARSFVLFSFFPRLAVFMRLPRILLPRCSISQLALSSPVEYNRARTVIVIVQCGRGVDGLIGIFKSCQPIYLSRILIGVLLEGVPT